MTFGNLAALVQKDVKRILGYSSVAHAGYIMIGFSVRDSRRSLLLHLFYALAYVCHEPDLFLGCKPGLC